ncbi:hypothetical protein [Streptomyces cinereoruber]|uniref:hypothetical protein n=1 Tax=Streptomyces cinereoruber TaxID=67260 RepID=UPI003C2FFCE0
MQDGSIQGEEASAWLKAHFAGEAEPSIDLGWRDEEPVSSASRRRILEILFSPRADTPSA